MKKLRLITCVALGLLSGVGIQAQMNNTLYFMKGVPQSNRVNPAYAPKENVYVGIPFLAPLRVEFSSNSLSHIKIASTTAFSSSHASCLLSLTRLRREAPTTDAACHAAQATILCRVFCIIILSFDVSTQSDGFGRNLTTTNQGRLRKFP